MAMSMIGRASWIASLPMLAGLLVGCGGADNPKIADAPAFTPAADNQAPPKIPGRKSPYGASTKYQQSMENMYLK